MQPATIMLIMLYPAHCSVYHQKQKWLIEELVGISHMDLRGAFEPDDSSGMQVLIHVTYLCIQEP